MVFTFICILNKIKFIDNQQRYSSTDYFVIKKICCVSVRLIFINNNVGVSLEYRKYMSRVYKLKKSLQIITALPRVEGNILQFEGYDANDY
jgi:hypothetical protein